MKQHDFLPNLILVLLTGLLAAGISCLAARGGIPYTYTSHTTVQLTGDELHTGDVNEYAAFVRSDATVLLSTVANLELQDADMRPMSVGELVKLVAVSTKPLEGIVEISVRTGDPYESRDIANEMVTVSGNLFEASHAGIRVNRVETALAAEECDKRPVGLFTLIGGLIGLLAGAAVAFMAVRKMRTEKRMKRTADSRYKKIVTDDEKEDDDLFADDNADVDPEMRELYRAAQRAKNSMSREEDGEDFSEIQEDPVSGEDVDFQELPADGEDDAAAQDELTEEEDFTELPADAGTAYREAMEIEAMGDDAGTEPVRDAVPAGNEENRAMEDNADTEPVIDEIPAGNEEDQTKGGDEDEA